MIYIKFVTTKLGTQHFITLQPDYFWCFLFCLQF